MHIIKCSHPVNAHYDKIWLCMGCIVNFCLNAEHWLDHASSHFTYRVCNIPKKQLLTNFSFFRRNNSLTTTQCIRSIYANDGLKGFYRGITASYVGVTETVIHFVIYEAMKAKFLEMSSHSYRQDTDRTTMDFLRFMVAGAISKTTATCVAYPHGRFMSLYPRHLCRRVYSFRFSVCPFVCSLFVRSFVSSLVQ